MMRSILAMVGAALLSVAPAAADDTASEVERVAGPLPRFFPHLESYLDIPQAERSHFRMAYVVSSAEGMHGRGRLRRDTTSQRWQRRACIWPTGDSGSRRARIGDV